MQLKYNEEFNDIIENIIQYKNIDDFDNIKEFIDNMIHNFYLYDYEKEVNICLNCLSEFNGDICLKCNKKYNIQNIENKVEMYELYDDYIFNFNIYFFDMQETLLLYNIEITYNINDKNYEVTINNVYQMTNLGIYDLVTNKYITFKELENKYIIGNEFLMLERSYLYKNNLDILKENRLYKYTLLYELKNIDNIKINLLSLTLFPLYYKQFEYLMKTKLYSLAFTCPYLFIYKNFKDNFGIDKTHYEFIKNNIFTEDDVKVLRMINEPNKELLDYYKNYSNILLNLIKYVRPNKLKEYLGSQNLSNDYLIEYRDYITYLKKLSIDTSDKKNLFPKNFLEQHDKLDEQIEIAKNKDIENKIISLSKVMSINDYSDDEYVIFPVSCIKDFIVESKKMHNCVRTYIESVGENKCQIYFMRHKNNINEPFVTIEVRDKKVIQARCKYNELPDEKINKILEKWEKNLIPICNEVV